MQQEISFWNEHSVVDSGQEQSLEEQIATLEEKLKEVEQQNSWVDGAIAHKKTYYKTMELNHEAQIQKIASNGRKQRNRAKCQYTSDKFENTLESSNEELRAERSAMIFEHAKKHLEEGFFQVRRTKAEVKAALEILRDEKKEKLLGIRDLVNDPVKLFANSTQTRESTCVRCDKQRNEEMLMRMR